MHYTLRIDGRTRGVRPQRERVQAGGAAGSGGKAAQRPRAGAHETGVDGTNEGERKVGMHCGRFLGRACA